MIRKAIATLALLITVGVLVVSFWPMGSTATGALIHTPTMAPCSTETGEGQALCYWDAQHMGNGSGTDVVAGECSVGSVGSTMASAYCMRLWAIEGYSYTYQGATVDVADGHVLVADCMDIEHEARKDADVRNELNAEGWNLTECFKAHIE